MSNPSRRPLALGWFPVLLLLGQAGGARHTVPLSQEMRAELGTVAVISARFSPSTELRVPAKGRVAGRGAARRALMGMAVAAMGGIWCVGLSCGVALALMPAGGLTGALIGAIHGGVTAVPGATVEDGSAELRSAVAELDLQEALRDRVLRVAQAQTCHHLVFDIGNGPRAPKKKVGYRLLAADGIQTVPEVSVLDFELNSPWQVNPELALVMSVQARLVRTSDGALLYDRTLDHRSMKRRFAAWAADGGGPFREERDDALRTLAGKIVAETLLIQVDGSEAYRG